MRRERFMNRVAGAWACLACVALAAGLMLGLAGCGGGGGGPGVGPGVDRIAEAWTAFEGGDYAGALQIFNEVLADSASMQATLGAGWANSFLKNLPAAETSLATVAAAQPTLPEAWAGLAVVRLARDESDGAIDAGTHLLNLNPNWTFTHHTTVNADDIRLAMAEAYFRKGASFFPQAQALLNVLDPANGLNPALPSTWIVEGVHYSDYTPALLRALQRVESLIGEPALF